MIPNEEWLPGDWYKACLFLRRVRLHLLNDHPKDFDGLDIIYKLRMLLTS